MGARQLGGTTLRHPRRADCGPRPILAGEYVCERLFGKLRQDRARAEHEDDYEMMYEPVVPEEEELEPGGSYDIALDKHTYPGSGIGRGWRHFRVFGARCGPNEDSAVGETFRRRMMVMDQLGYRDGTMHFSEAEIEHALTPTDPDKPWEEPSDLLNQSIEGDSE